MTTTSSFVSTLATLFGSLLRISFCGFAIFFLPWVILLEQLIPPRLDRRVIVRPSGYRYCRVSAYAYPVRAQSRMGDLARAIRCSASLRTPLLGDGRAGAETDSVAASNVAGD